MPIPSLNLLASTFVSLWLVSKSPASTASLLGPKEERLTFLIGFAPRAIGGCSHEQAVHANTIEESLPSNIALSNLTRFERTLALTTVVARAIHLESAIKRLGNGRWTIVCVFRQLEIDAIVLRLPVRVVRNLHLLVICTDSRAPVY
jgi:hypothetical protein